MIRRAGDRAMVIDRGCLADVHALRWALAQRRLDGVEELVGGLVCLTVVFDPAVISFDALANEVRSARVEGFAAGAARLIEIPVVYDGADLAEVADRCGLSVAEVKLRHSAVEYTVAIVGFSAGLGYLQGLDPQLSVPRRESPRVSVPAGAVAIAADMTCVYPRSSPGGWQLLGHSDLAMWDAGLDPPGLLSPGDRVRFRPVIGHQSP